MAKEPKFPAGPKVDYESATGPIPPENFDNDQRCRDDSEVDTSPGSAYDILAQRDKASKANKANK